MAEAVRTLDGAAAEACRAALADIDRMVPDSPASRAALFNLYLRRECAATGESKTALALVNAARGLLERAGGRDGQPR